MHNTILDLIPLLFIDTKSYILKSLNASIAGSVILKHKHLIRAV